MFWFDAFWILVLLLVIAAVTGVLTVRERRTKFHCAVCKKTLRYPTCCPHISEAGWAMIKNAPKWELPK